MYHGVVLYRGSLVRLCCGCAVDLLHPPCHSALYASGQTHPPIAGRKSTAKACDPMSVEQSAVRHRTPTPAVPCVIVPLTSVVQTSLYAYFDCEDMSNYCQHHFVQGSRSCPDVSSHAPWGCTSIVAPCVGTGDPTGCDGSCACAAERWKTTRPELAVALLASTMPYFRTEVMGSMLTQAGLRVTKGISPR